MEKTSAEFVTLAETTEVAPGQVKVYEVQGRRIALCNVDGAFYAIDDVCTHDGGSLDQGELEGYQIECPRHGARFDVRNGRVLALPAVMPVRSYPVLVEDGVVKAKVT
jgi:3-phenylpropionate/trans-cinnamate dioxygenase ferredoxin component